MKKNGLVPAFYKLVQGDRILTENDTFFGEEKFIINIIKEPKQINPILTFHTNAYRGGESSLTPAGYAAVICKLEIELEKNKYKIEIDTQFFDVKYTEAFMNWQDPQEKKLELDQDLGNFAALVGQGYSTHDEVISVISQNYEKIHENIIQLESYESCLDDEFGSPECNDGNCLLFIRLDREINLKSDMNTVSTAREYLNCLYTHQQYRYLSFDEIIGWGLCTLLKHELKAEMPIRLILDAIVSVIYDLNTKGPISEAEIHKQFYGHVSSVVQEFVNTKVQSATN